MLIRYWSLARGKYRATMGKHELVSWEKPTGSGEFQETICLEVKQKKPPPPRTESSKAESLNTLGYTVSSRGSQATELRLSGSP